MAKGGPGKGKRVVSTTLTHEEWRKLTALAKAGGWRTPSAYIRAVLQHHAQAKRTIAEARTLYTIPATGKHAAEDGPDWPDGLRPLAPGCCPAAAAAMGDRGNGGGG